MAPPANSRHPRSDFPRALGFTALVLLVWHLGSFVPLPGIDVGIWLASQPNGKGWLASIVQRVATDRLSTFALQLMPYVTALVFVDLWLVMRFGRGASARLSQSELYATEKRTRLLALAIAAVQGYGVAVGIEGVPGMVLIPGLAFQLGCTASLVAGTALQMWLAELITRHGITNGVWLMIAAGYVADVPTTLLQVSDLHRVGIMATSTIVQIALAVVATIALIVLVEQATYRVPLKTRGGAEVEPLRLRINFSGVLPVAMVQWFILLPLAYSATSDTSLSAKLGEVFQDGRTGYFLLQSLLIVAMTLLYTYISTSPQDMASDLDEAGIDVDGVAAGRATERYLGRLIMALATACGLYLAVLALAPVTFAQFGTPAIISGIGLLTIGLTALDVCERYGLVDPWLDDPSGAAETVE